MAETNFACPALTFTGTGDSFSVKTGTVAIALISKQFDASAWRWEMYPRNGPPGYRLAGMAASLDQAKDDVERMWGLWIGAACPRTQ